MMTSLLLQTSGPKQDGGISLMLMILLIVCAVAYGVVKLYRASKLIRHLALLHSIRNNGSNSFTTIAALDNVVRDMLKSEGVNVTDLKIVHEIGNRYNAVLTTAGNKTYDMSITADRAGNVQYRIN